MEAGTPWRHTGAILRQRKCKVWFGSVPTLGLPREPQRSHLLVLHPGVSFLIPYHKPPADVGVLKQSDRNLQLALGGGGGGVIFCRAINPECMVKSVRSMMQVRS
jgi:hypothetical protein